MAISSQNTSNIKTRIRLLISSIILGACAGSVGGFMIEKGRLAVINQASYGEAVVARGLEIAGFCKPWTFDIFENATKLCRWLDSIRQFSETKGFIAATERVYTAWPIAGMVAALCLLLITSNLLARASRADQ